MAETIINRSPAITTREIEIQPANAAPVGTPAGVVGTSLLGPAFVPVTVGNFTQFRTLFGDNTDGERQGVVAAREFLRNGTAFTFLRVLGAGIGGPISSVTVGGESIYYYDRAGFVAGNPNLNGPSGADISTATGTNVWFIGHAAQDIDHSDLYIENILKSGGEFSSGTTVLPNAANDPDRASAVVLRSVVFTSGSAKVFLYSGTNATSASYNSDWNCSFGTIGGTNGNPASDSQNTQRQQFVMSVGTTSDPDLYFGPLTCSMDPNRGDYIANVLNTDPSSFTTKGHLFYSVFDCDPSLITMSGSNGTSITLPTSASGSFIAFSATDTAIAARQNDYASRFRAPIASTVISQPIGNTEYDLFTVESLHDGYAPAQAFKITITNISKPSVLNSQPYGTFDLIVRQYNDTDNNMIILEQFTNCTLDPNSESFIGRKIGTRKTYYDFNQAIEEDRKLVEDGDFPNNSNYIRLILNRELAEGRVPKASLPFGFHGPSVLVPPSLSTSVTRVTIPPIPFRQTISQGVHSTDKSRRRNLSLNWGTQFTQQNVPSSGRGQDDPNGSDRQSQGIMGFLKMYSVPEVNFMVTGSFNDNWEAAGFNADTYLNNKFSLNNVALMKGLDTGYTVSDLNTVTINDAKYFRYFRGGVPSVTQSLGDLAALNTPTEIATYNRINAVASFNFFVQCGFDGTNYQNRDSRLLSNLAVRNAENNVTLPGGLDDNTVNAYLHGLNIMSDPSLVSINLFAIPGIKQAIITDRAIQAIEDNFDSLYIMDIDDRLEANANDISSVGDVVATFEARSLDSSFAAAYYPDLRLVDETFGRTITVAPSAPVLGAMAFNDRVSSPFEAPAGFNRGVLPTVTSTTQRLTKRDRDDLYEVNINPIYQPPGSEFVIFGQKTLEANIDSSLNRINVRRLLIELRRQVRQASQRILFEQATVSQLERLTALVTPILDRVQARGGIVQYRVEINEQTTTQTDLNNLTVKGRITIQPTKTIEFINLDFVIDQAGVTFNT
jgi:hypothetical protein